MMPPAVRLETTASPAPRARFDAAEPAPDVSIVVVAYGTGPVVLDTLASIAAAARVDPDPSVEVIVVSNPHPVHGQRTLVDLRLSTRGVCVVIPPDNLGFGGGCELGALAARGELLAFVNPDVEVPTGWLGPLVAAIRSKPVAPHIAAPVLVEADGSVQEIGQRLYRTGATAPILERGPDDGPVAVDYASAACWVMTRDAHERLGGFDAAYHPAYFEDVDLALRVHRAGGRCLVVPTVRVVHHRGVGTPDDAAPASAQRDRLLERWPAVRWERPAEPGARGVQLAPNTASTIRRA